MGYLKNAKEQTAPMQGAETEEPEAASSEQASAPPTAHKEPSGSASAAPSASADETETVSEEAATPEEQAEYERAVGALYAMLYTNEGTSKAVLDMIQPNNKVDSIAKAAVLIIQQLDDKLDLDEAVIPQLVMDVPDELIEIGERAKGMTFSDGELQAILGATQELTMQVFDVDAKKAQQLVGSLSPDQRASAERTYQKYLGSASKAVPNQPQGAQ